MTAAAAGRKVIATHLAKHVAQRNGCRVENLDAVAGTVLSHLYSCENTGTPWESDNGVPPTVLWAPQPAGGAIAALLGLIGTGLLGEYEAADAKQILLRDVRGSMSAFGHECHENNSPVPTESRR